MSDETPAREGPPTAGELLAAARRLVRAFSRTYPVATEIEFDAPGDTLAYCEGQGLLLRYSTRWEIFGAHWSRRTTLEIAGFHRFVGMARIGRALRHCRRLARRCVPGDPFQSAFAALVRAIGRSPWTDGGADQILVRTIINRFGFGNDICRYKIKVTPPDAALLARLAEWRPSGTVILDVDHQVGRKRHPRRAAMRSDARAWYAELGDWQKVTDRVNEKYQKKYKKATVEAWERDERKRCRRRAARRQEPPADAA
jgi:hypothetical protein